MRRTLATKFVLIIAGIAALGLLNGLTTLGFTRLVANCLRSAVSEDFPSVKAAEELGIALSDQRGLVSVYIIDEGNPSWLERLRRAEADFDTWLSCARASAYTSGENKILDELEKVYAEYGPNARSHYSNSIEANGTKPSRRCSTKSGPPTTKQTTPAKTSSR